MPVPRSGKLSGARLRRAEAGLPLQQVQPHYNYRVRLRRPVAGLPLQQVQPHYNYRVRLRRPVAGLPLQPAHQHNSTYPTSARA